MKFVKIKQFLINSWFILMLLNIVADSFESDELRIILGLFTLGFYIAILSKYAKHESKLFQACREEEIRKQVEVVLEQRERKSS